MRIGIEKQHRSILRLLLLLLVMPAFSAEKNIFTRRFLRITGTPTVQANYDEIMARARDAATAGYNGLFLDNSKIWSIAKQNAAFVAKVKQLQADLKGIGLTFMPYSLGQGEQTIMSREHTVAFPMRATPFVVSGGQATVKPDPSLTVPNGGFETLSGPVPGTWKYAGIAPNTNFFVDKDVKTEGSQSIRVQDVKGSSVVLSQNIIVKPFRVYRFTAMIKTQGLSYTRGLAFEATAPSRGFVLKEGNQRRLPKTTNWTRHQASFTALEQTSVKLLFCVWPEPCSTGTVWVDDVKIEEMGFFELHMGRPSLKVTVKSADGTKTYSQGSDYTIDYKLEPYYQSKLLIPAGSSIADGSELSVDWYKLAGNHHWSTTTFCSDAVWTSIRGNVKALHDAIGPLPGWFNKLSEWRNGNWDPACPAMFKDLSEYQGKTSRMCFDLLREYSPNVEMYVWNDAFDPYHNGQGPYALNNGVLVNNWNYMDPNTIILNWNEGKKEPSVRFFSGLDPKYPGVFLTQLISMWSTVGPEPWLKVIDKLEGEGMHKNAVIGVQYTTWQARDYTRIAEFADICKEAGRWGANTDPFVPFERPGVAATAMSARYGLELNAYQRKAGSLGIGYQIPVNGFVKAWVVDSRGRTIGKLVHEKQDAGKHELSWSTANMPAGVYFLRLQVDDGSLKRERMCKTVVF